MHNFSSFFAPMNLFLRRLFDNAPQAATGAGKVRTAARSQMARLGTAPCRA